MRVMMRVTSERRPMKRPKLEEDQSCKRNKPINLFGSFTSAKESAKLSEQVFG
jgi:hypothetical protein